MEYRAVGNRCAVNIESLNLPISNAEALAILKLKGFAVVEVDIIALARQCIGKSKYRRGARLHEAPSVVDCSSFIKWLYGERGIWLPRRTIQQSEHSEPVALDALVSGDVVFVSGWINYYRDDPACGIGHAGIVTEDDTIIHAANKRFNVVETSFERFVRKSKYCCARRYVPIGAEVLTLEAPRNRGVEIADDIRWIILQSLPKTKRSERK